MSTGNRELDKKRMRIAIQRLPEAYREVLLGIHTQKLSPEELAEALRISPVAVQTRLKEGTALLRRVMEEMQNEEG